MPINSQSYKKIFKNHNKFIWFFIKLLISTPLEYLRYLYLRLSWIFRFARCFLNNKKRDAIKNCISKRFCAQDETRTHTALRPLPPQSSVYTNFTTCAGTIKFVERKTGLEPATPTLARLCSTNWAISAKFCKFCEIFISHLRMRSYCFFLIWPNVFVNIFNIYI